MEVSADAAAALALQQTLQAQIRKLKFAKYHANSLRQDSLQQHCSKVIWARLFGEWKSYPSFYFYGKATEVCFLETFFAACL